MTPWVFLVSFLFFPFCLVAKELSGNAGFFFNESQWLEKGTPPFPMWDFQRVGEPMDSPMYRSREQLSTILLQLEHRNQTESYQSQLSFSALIGNNGNPSLYLGKNSFLAISMGESLIGVGRRMHQFRNSPFSGSWDGGDGLYWERPFLRKGIFQVFLYDVYSGYRLWEKEIYRQIEVGSGLRRRHSVGFQFGEIWRWSLGIQTIQPGSLGRLGRERNDSLEEKGGDGDTYQIVNFGIKRELSSIWFQAEFYLSRGREITAGKTLPVQGEAFQFGFGYKKKGFQWEWANHFPDDEQRTEGGVVKNQGHIGTGVHIGSTPFISQILQIYPSAWFNGNGLERHNTVWKGRVSSFFSETKLSFQHNDWTFYWISAYILPRSQTGASSGKISLKREEYESFFFWENALGLEWRMEENVRLSILVSHIRMGQDSYFQGTFGSFAGNLCF